MYSVVDELGSIIERLDFETRWHMLLTIQPVDLFAHALDNDRRVFAAQHHDDAFNHPFMLDHVASLITQCDRHAPGRRRATRDHVRHVTHQNGAPLLRTDNGHLDILQITVDARTAQNQAFTAATQNAAAGVIVIGRNSIGQLVQCDAITAHGNRVGIDLNFLDGATEACHIGDTRRPANDRTNHPILHHADFIERRSFRCLKHITKDFADCRRQRRQCGRYARRQRDIL